MMTLWGDFTSPQHHLRIIKTKHRWWESPRWNIFWQIFLVKQWPVTLIHDNWTQSTRDTDPWPQPVTIKYFNRIVMKRKNVQALKQIQNLQETALFLHWNNPLLEIFSYHYPVYVVSVCLQIMIDVERLQRQCQSYIVSGTVWWWYCHLGTGNLFLMITFTQPMPGSGDTPLTDGGAWLSHLRIISDINQYN